MELGKTLSFMESRCFALVELARDLDHLRAPCPWVEEPLLSVPHACVICLIVCRMLCSCPLVRYSLHFILTTLGLM